MEIRTNTLAEAHILTCAAIYEDCIEIVTEDNEVTFEYPEPILVIVEDPLNEDMVSPLCGFGPLALEEYARDLIYGRDDELGFVYTYHDRLFAYYYDGRLMNQIDALVDKLRLEPNTRRAQAITWYPNIDLRSREPPCLQRIQCLIRNGRLNMSVDFRSNDCLSAMGQNMYALVKLQEVIANHLGLSVGTYTHYITCPHLYFKRDAEELNTLRQLICRRNL